MAPSSKPIWEVPPGRVILMTRTSNLANKVYAIVDGARCLNIAKEVQDKFHWRHCNASMALFEQPQQERDVWRWAAADRYEDEAAKTVRRARGGR